MASAQPRTAVKIVLGAMTIGNGAEQSRVTDISEARKIIDIFRCHGHNEIDTSRFYGSGTSEEYLGRIGWKDLGLVMDTKIYPTVGKNFPGEQISLQPKDLREHLQRSLKALKAEKVDMWYLHGKPQQAKIEWPRSDNYPAPDRTTPLINTLREVNKLHQEGLFDTFAISNYMAWEVAQICELCSAHGWVKPSVYQGVYNALHRTVEAELFPCLRHYDIGFYAYNPLGGGFFTGGFSMEGEVEKGSRFDPARLQGQAYRARYFRDEYFQAMDDIKPVADKHGLTLAEVALRWMTHHSKLGKVYNDAILIGASR